MSIWTCTTLDLPKLYTLRGEPFHTLVVKVETRQDYIIALQAAPKPDKLHYSGVRGDRSLSPCHAVRSRVGFLKLKAVGYFLSVMHPRTSLLSIYK